MCMMVLLLLACESLAPICSHDVMVNSQYTILFPSFKVGIGGASALLSRDSCGGVVITSPLELLLLIELLLA
jgi:hypothetical protein